MYIIAHWNGHGMRVGCMICGEGFDLGEVASDALTEDAPHEMIGAICDACIVLSEAEMRQRLPGRRRRVTASGEAPGRASRRAPAFARSTGHLADTPTHQAHT
jgi:hypothetical protein